jgi:DNA-binding NtrC family response regulator
MASREETKKRSARAQELLGLFAYHRDAPLVARALRVSLEELMQELEELKIRRKAFVLARGSAAQMPKASSVPGPAGPPVRRRTKSPPPPAPPPPRISEREQQARELRTLLSEEGARRRSIAQRLGGISDATLLARFRAAGLEREFSLRERDLIRALYARHRGSEIKVAKEIGLSTEELHAVVLERGLSAEVTRLRARFHPKMR